MECIICLEELDENTVRYDWLGNEWCPACLLAEMNRESEGQVNEP